MPIESLNCPNCGATFPREASYQDAVRCEHCGTAFRLQNGTAFGKYILQPDFARASLNGWELNEDDKQFQYSNAPVPELLVSLPPTSLMRTVMSTTGVFDDFDVTLTSRFLEGKLGGMSVGIKFRRSDDGDYLVCLAGNGMYCLGWHKQNDWGGDFVNWTAHPAARPGLGIPNQVRVTMQGEHMQVYINGLLVSSLQDGRFRSGYLRLVVSPPREMPMTLAISELTLRVGK